MDVSRETPDVTTKPKCYDLTDILVRSQARPDPRLSTRAWGNLQLRRRIHRGVADVDVGRADVVGRVDDALDRQGLRTDGFRTGSGQAGSSQKCHSFP